MPKAGPAASFPWSPRGAGGGTAHIQIWVRMLRWGAGALTRVTQGGRGRAGTAPEPQSSVHPTSQPLRASGLLRLPWCTLGPAPHPAPSSIFPLFQQPCGVPCEIHRHKNLGYKTDEGDCSHLERVYHGISLESDSGVLRMM